MESLYEKGGILACGKTKEIYEAIDAAERVVPGLVIIRNKDDITAFDDPSFTKEFASKARCATATTCRVFELLRNAGIPVAYEEQLSVNEFVSQKCGMIPLEVVTRRYAVGSFLKRHPELQRPGSPYRFHRVRVEFFLKTTKGKVGWSDNITDLGLDSEKGEEDPLIEDIRAMSWKLFHSKKPAWEAGAWLNKSVEADYMLPPMMPPDIQINDMEEIAHRVFLVLESAWGQLNYRFIDLKIEFGVTADGRLVVADVVDNDSWRLKDWNWNEVSKQAFRDGEDLAKVEENYGLVARLAERLRIPKQGLVFWRGSPSDEDLVMEKGLLESDLLGYENIICSGHKATGKSLSLLGDFMTKYPEGGVIIAEVGMSDGLGPVLAAHTTWPVIAVPATLKTFPVDVWSSVRMPSGVPLATVGDTKNALNLALNILSQKNPWLYMVRQYAMEMMEP